MECYYSLQMEMLPYFHLSVYSNCFCLQRTKSGSRKSNKKIKIEVDQDKVVETVITPTLWVKSLLQFGFIFSTEFLKNGWRNRDLQSVSYWRRVCIFHRQDKKAL